MRTRVLRYLNARFGRADHVISSPHQVGMTCRDKDVVFSETDVTHTKKLESKDGSPHQLETMTFMRKNRPS